jgi:hypothetical protein
MIPEDMNVMIWNQDRSFSDWGRTIDSHVSGHPEYRPRWREFKKFMQGMWSNFINRWTEDYPKIIKLGKDKWSDYIYEWYKSLMKHVKYASTLGYPISRELLSFQVTQIGAESMHNQTLTHDPEYQKFHSLCGITILADEDEKNPVLCAFVKVRNSHGELQHYEKCVQLTPLVEMIADRIRAYHDHLHGVPTEVSGYRNKRTRGRRKVISRRTRDSYPAPSYGPSHPEYGPSERYAHQPDYDPSYSQEPGNYGPTLADMRSRDPALAQQQYYWDQAGSNLPAPSYGPSHAPEPDTYSSDHWRMPPGTDFLDAPEELLPLGVDPLQVSGWYDNIVNTARHLAESKAVKNLYHDLKNIAKNKGVQQIALTALIGPVGASAAMSLGYKVNALVVAAKAGDEMAAEKLDDLNASAKAGNAKAQQAMDTALNINDLMNDKAANIQEQVQGWWYNRPYRTTLQALTSSFPGVGIAMRQGWHDGLEFAKTMKRRPLRSFNLGF